MRIWFISRSNQSMNSPHLDSSLSVNVKTYQEQLLKRRVALDSRPSCSGPLLKWIACCSKCRPTVDEGFNSHTGTHRLRMSQWRSTAQLASRHACIVLCLFAAESSTTIWLMECSTLRKSSMPYLSHVIQLAVSKYSSIV